MCVVKCNSVRHGKTAGSSTARQWMQRIYFTGWHQKVTRSHINDIHTRPHTHIHTHDYHSQYIHVPTDRQTERNGESISMYSLMYRHLSTARSWHYNIVHASKQTNQQTNNCDPTRCRETTTHTHTHTLTDNLHSSPCSVEFKFNIYTHKKQPSCRSTVRPTDWRPETEMRTIKDSATVARQLKTTH